MGQVRYAIDMHAATNLALVDELTKIALTRWQKELGVSSTLNPDAEVGEALKSKSYHKARISPEDQLRLPKEVREMAQDQHTMSPEDIAERTRGARNKMWGPGTDLTAEQLGRHRNLNQRIGHTLIDEMGGKHENMPGMGPATVGGVPMVAPDAGTGIRRMTEGPIGKLQGSMALVGSPIGKISPKPEDATMYRGVVAHEGGERAMFLAAKDKLLPARAMASHFGGLPQLEEQMASYRDPAAQQAWRSLREGTGGDDALIYKKIRQFGGRPDSPLPIGGKGHFALERDLAKRGPGDMMAAVNRLTAAAGGMGVNPNLEKSPGAVGAIARTGMSGAEGLATHLPRVGGWLQGQKAGLEGAGKGVADKLRAGGEALEKHMPGNVADWLQTKAPNVAESVGDLAGYKAERAGKALTDVGSSAAKAVKDIRGLGVADPANIGEQLKRISSLARQVRK